MRMLPRGPRRAEHGYGWTDLRQAIKAARELGCDLPDPLGVGGPATREVTSESGPTDSAVPAPSSAAMVATTLSASAAR